MKMPKWLDDLLTNSTPVCQDVVRWISQEIEQPLPWYRKIQMHTHFLICEFCKRYREQVTMLRTLLHSDAEKLTGSEITESQHLSSDAKQRIKDALRDK